MSASSFLFSAGSSTLDIRKMEEGKVVQIVMKEIKPSLSADKMVSKGENSNESAQTIKTNK